MMKKLSYKYNKRITTRDNGNVQSHDKEESKLNSTITANSGAHTLTHDQIIKKVHTIKLLCQLKLLQEEIRHKKCDVKVLKKEFNSRHFSLQHEI